MSLFIYRNIDLRLRFSKCRWGWCVWGPRELNTMNYVEIRDKLQICFNLFCSAKKLSTKRHHPEINRYDRKHDHSTCPHHYMICFLSRTRTQTQSGMTSWGRKAFFLPKRSLKKMRRKSWPLNSSLLVRQQSIVTLFYPNTAFDLCICSWNLRNCQSYYYCYLFNDFNEYFWKTKRWTCCI